MNTNRSIIRSRSLRRVALSAFPAETLNEAAVQTVVDEGYTDIGIALVVIADEGSWQKGEGWTLTKARELAKLAEKQDLGLVIFTGYMKYQELSLRDHPERAFVTYGAGTSLDSDGLPSRWLCPFQPKNKQMYVEQLHEVATWPAVREIHLNDEASLGVGTEAIGCYCKFCTEQFRKHAGEDPPRSAKWDDPLWWEWLEYRMDKWVEVHAGFRVSIQKVDPTVEVGIQHSPFPACFIRRPWQSAISLARDATALDLLATDPYHFNHSNHIAYRPHRRIQAEAARSLIGACQKRGAEIYPQAFMPPGRSAPLTRQDALMAGILPFALGADTVVPYSYELSRIIPGFTEGFADTLRLQSDLDKHSPYAYVTVIKPHQSEIRGHYDCEWGEQYLAEIANLMYRVTLPWRWFWDERIVDAADELHGPLIVPDAHCLTEEQLAVIDELARKGHGVLWIGNRPAQPWTGRGACPLPSEFHQGTVELSLNTDHDILSGLNKPVMLCSSVDDHGPNGTILGTVADRPGLVIQEDGRNRQAWLAGLPMHSYIPPDLHGATRMPTDGAALLRALLDWLAPDKPLIKSSPMTTDYGKLRVWDSRDVPTAEMFPLVSDDGVIAIMFPYAPCAYETSLTVNVPEGKKLVSVQDLWQNTDMTARVQYDEPGRALLLLEVSGECELLAIHFRFD